MLELTLHTSMLTSEVNIWWTQESLELMRPISLSSLDATLNLRIQFLMLELRRLFQSMVLKLLLLDLLLNFLIIIFILETLLKLLSNWLRELIHSVRDWRPLISQWLWHPLWLSRDLMDQLWWTMLTCSKKIPTFWTKKINGMDSIFFTVMLVELTLLSLVSPPRNQVIYHQPRLFSCWVLITSDMKKFQKMLLLFIKDILVMKELTTPIWSFQLQAILRSKELSLTLMEDLNNQENVFHPQDLLKTTGWSLEPFLKKSDLHYHMTLLKSLEQDLLNLPLISSNLMLLKDLVLKSLLINQMETLN